jgi:hypothetical protein
LLELMFDPARSLKQIFVFLSGKIVELQKMLDLHNALAMDWIKTRKRESCSRFPTESQSSHQKLLYDTR